MNLLHQSIIASLFLLGSWNAQLFAQVECAAPGNLRGIRVDGELMAFSTGIRAVVPKEMRVFVTDSRRGMQETGRVPVVQGTVQLPLDGMSFTSLAGNP